MDKFSNEFWDERKSFLPMAIEPVEGQCNWLTIGIGTKVEKNVKQKYPECSVYGAEPGEHKDNNFDGFGTLINYDIGNLFHTQR